MLYDTSASASLARARTQLITGTPAAIIYAALELRCGIETRAREYASSQESLSTKKKMGWEVAKLAKDLERTFRIGDRIVEIRVTTLDHLPLARWLHTPVGPTLARSAGRLGALVHALPYSRREDSQWWNATKEFLEGVASKLEVALAGNLMGPPLRNKKTGRVTVSAVADDAGQATQLKSLKGEAVLFIVKYHAMLPPDWVSSSRAVT